MTNSVPGVYMKITAYFSTVLIMILSSTLLYAGSNFIQIIPKELKGSDIQFMQDKARIELDDKKEGDTVNWYNEETSNSGSVKLIRRFEKDSSQCMEVMHKVLLDTNSDNFSFKSTLCKDPAGKWYSTQ